MGYDLLLKQCEASIDPSLPFASLSNVSSVLFHEIEGLNWVGFYFAKHNRLELAMFQGKPACAILPFGKGVCAAGFGKNETVVVDDVLSFPGHIACDSASRSEIVLPLRLDGRPIGVLDIDSDRPSRFGKEETEFLTKLRDLLEEKLPLKELSPALFD